MSIPDLKPTRFLNTLKMLQLFIEEFFDQNPISQVGIILLKNKRAEKIADLAGNYKNHVKMLQGWDFKNFFLFYKVSLLW